MKLNRRRSQGFSLIELLIVIAIILIIATIALPKLNKARMYAMETAAIAHIRTLHTAQTQYFSMFGKFAPSLVELGPPASGNSNASAADLIPSDLATGDKGGYKFTLAGSPVGYTINASPTAYGNTGSRTFFSDQTMVVRENYGPEPATDKSKELR
jgi:prepilin-type N-terminal cleavage/methylation domain-containing protein